MAADAAALTDWSLGPIFRVGSETSDLTFGSADSGSTTFGGFGSGAVRSIPEPATALALIAPRG